MAAWQLKLANKLGPRTYFGGGSVHFSIIALFVVIFVGIPLLYRVASPSAAKGSCPSSSSSGQGLLLSGNASGQVERIDHSKLPHRFFGSEWPDGFHVMVYGMTPALVPVRGLTYHEDLRSESVSFVPRWNPPEYVFRHFFVFVNKGFPDKLRRTPIAHEVTVVHLAPSATTDLLAEPLEQTDPCIWCCHRISKLHTAGSSGDPPRTCLAT